MATLQQALVAANAAQAFPSNVVRVRYTGRGVQRVITVRQRAAAAAPSSKVPTNETPTLQEVRSNPGGWKPRLAVSNVWDRCAQFGAQSGWGGSQFGRLTGFYNSKSEAKGQGKALHGVI